MDETIKRALNEQVSIPVGLAGRAFGLSRNAAYAAVKSGQIPSVRIGARIAVPTAPNAWYRDLPGGHVMARNRVSRRDGPRMTRSVMRFSRSRAASGGSPPQSKNRSADHGRS